MSGKLVSPTWRLADAELPRSLKILLIGGTGFVGQQIAPSLKSRGHQVTVASRITDSSRDIIGRECWDVAIANSDVVVVLSVINNDVAASKAEIHAVNVDMPLDLMKSMNGVHKQSLILFGSDHADADATSAYAASKAVLLQRLRDQSNTAVTMLILSPVHGDAFVKRLAFIDRLPGTLRSMAVSFLGALRPLTHVDRIVDEIEDAAYSGENVLAIRRVVDDQNHNIFYRSVTRLLDLAFAVAVLLVFGWLMAILAFLIVATSNGPALFRQQRVGRHGKLFICYKFRTMRVNTPQVPTHQVAADSTTHIGKYLRSWKLDELPQIFNIFTNEMSLVGPRPCLPSQRELVDARSRLGVLGIKPGVTGWSQVREIDMSNPQKLAESDAEFSVRRSLILYCRIVIQTFLGRGLGDRIR